MTNTNCKNTENCNSCNYCNYCNSCNYCYSCYSCNYCNSCYSCNYCNYCNYCNSCYSCNYCNSCNYCYSCYSCNYCNYCNYCSGLRMSERMLFCLGDGKYKPSGEGYQKNNRIFNKEVTEDVFDKALQYRPTFKLPIAVWVDKKDMTDDEKTMFPSYTQTGGYLRVLSYKDAWAEGWKTASNEFKTWVKELPNFDATIFEKITGIKIGDETLIGTTATVEIGGKKYKALIQEAD